MDAYDVVLAVHLLSLLVMAGGIMSFALSFSRLRSALTLEEAEPWVRLVDRAGWAFPVSILGLVASGAYLTSHSWAWSTAWIDVSIAGLVLVALQGPLVGGPRTKALVDALHANGPGELGEAPRRLARDPGALDRAPRESGRRARHRLDHGGEARDGRRRGRGRPRLCRRRRRGHRAHEIPAGRPGHGRG